MGLPYGENFIILTSTVFYDIPVWRTNRRTDRRDIFVTKTKTKTRTIALSSVRTKTKTIAI